MTGRAFTTPELALRDAIRARLRADPAFAAMASGRIYDEVPADLRKLDAPYVYFGPMRRAGYEIGCGEVWTVQARLYAVSTAFARDQGWRLVETMIRALNQIEQPDLPLADPYSLRTPVSVVQAGDVIDPLQAKSVFFDLTTSIARPLPA